ncbi:MAG: PhoU domain-containing protein, partial [Candidatus Fermentibacteria bacterium]
NIVEVRDRIAGNFKIESGELATAAVQASEILTEMLTSTRLSLQSHDRDASNTVLALESRLNRLEDDARRSYTDCLTSKGEDGLKRLALLDFIEYCERVGDHLTNIAQSLIGGGVWHGTNDIH